MISYIKNNLKILNLFTDYLKKANLSKTSIKNYLSDVVFFEKWMIREMNKVGASPNGIDELIPFINEDTAKHYKMYLTKGGFPVQTQNRRLVTLRKLSKFLYKNDLIDIDFAKRVKNLKKEGSSSVSILDEFKKYLVDKNKSKNTIKNYLSDVNQFFSWLEDASDIKAKT